MDSPPDSRLDPSAWENHEAIFIEKWIISHVRVRDIRATEKFLKARLAVIPTWGFYGREGPETSIGCVWKYLFLGKDVWAGRGYCQWCVFFSPGLIKTVLGIAESFPKDVTFEPYDPYYCALAKPLKEYEAREAPDPDRLALEKLLNSSEKPE